MADLKDLARLCKSHRNGRFCEATCPIFCSIERISEDGCFYYITHYTEEAEKIIDKWVSEHPIKTYKDDFFEKLPKARRDGSNLPCDCVNNLYGTDFHCDKTCKSCWNEEYKEEEGL